MATYKGLREAVDKVAAIKVDGFDNDWLLRAFARKQALINIKLIKPYTNKYNLIVRYLVTGDESIREEVQAAAADSAANANAAVDAYADYADYAAAAADAAADAAANAANAAVYAAVYAAAAYSQARDKAIATLNEMVDEYINKLDVVKRCECCGQKMEKQEG